MTLEEARGELGVSARAGQAAIRSAFKRLAFRHHPDHNPDRPEAAERFHRLCLAYEILRGERAPAPSPPRAAPQGKTEPSRWQRRGKPPRAPAPPRPEKWPSGAPIHYPTPEEIAALDAPRTGGSRRSAIIFLLALASLLGLLGFLEAMSGREPARLDPLRAKLRQDLGRRW